VVAVKADVPRIGAHVLDFPDKEINALGARGIGEIRLAGIAPPSPMRCTTPRASACGSCR